MSESIGIGDEMTYTDSRGRSITGLVLNTESATLTNVFTGERFTARRFYVWDSKSKRGLWTCAMRPQEAEAPDVR